jgi:hypothetical protein
MVLEELSGASERPMMISMPTTARLQQHYDHRLRNLVVSEKSIALKTRGFRGWVRRTLRRRKEAIPNDVTLCYAPLGASAKPRTLKQIWFSDTTGC